MPFPSCLKLRGSRSYLVRFSCVKRSPIFFFRRRSPAGRPGRLQRPPLCRGGGGVARFSEYLTFSSIPSPQNQRFCLTNDHFHGCSTQGRIQSKKKYPHIPLCAKVYRSMTSGRVVCVEGHRTSGDTTGIIGAGFETGDFVEKKLGGLP